MIAKDFQLGDWANLTYTKRDGTVVSENFKIAQLRSPYAGQPIDVWSEEGNMGHEGVSPIPLTPEILEKNEWKDDNDISECLGIEVFANEKNKCGVEFYGEDEFSFNIYDRWEDTDDYGAPMDGGYRYVTSIYHLHYVHELQHALRLCGLNELADNFKV